MFTETLEIDLELLPEAAPVRPQLGTGFGGSVFDYDLSSFQPFCRQQGLPIDVIRDRNAPALARWMATNDEGTLPQGKLLQICKDEHPNAFESFRIMHLDAPSVNLPGGCVVFRSRKNPEFVEDSPPGQIYDRLQWARQRFTTWVHEPVFTRDEEGVRLLTPKELIQLADLGNEEILELSERRGGLYRTELGLYSLWANVHRAFAHLRSCYEVSTALQKVIAGGALLRGERLDAYDLVLRAKALGLEDEANYVLLQLDGRQGVSPMVLESAQRYRDGRSAPSLFWALYGMRKAFRYQDECAAAGFVAITVGAIAALALIDPVLTFEREDQPGVHYLIGHWDWVDTKSGEKKLLMHI